LDYITQSGYVVYYLLRTARTPKYPKIAVTTTPRRPIIAINTSGLNKFPMPDDGSGGRLGAVVAAGVGAGGYPTSQSYPHGESRDAGPQRRTYGITKRYWPPRGRVSGF